MANTQGATAEGPAAAMAVPVSNRLLGAAILKKASRTAEPRGLLGRDREAGLTVVVSH